MSNERAPKRSIPGYKNANGEFIPAPTAKPNENISLDAIGKNIITALDMAVGTILGCIEGGRVDRETVGALKDCQAMLKDLKKDERDFLDSLTDEQLAELGKK